MSDKVLLITFFRPLIAYRLDFSQAKRRLEGGKCSRRTAFAHPLLK